MVHTLTNARRLSNGQAMMLELFDRDVAEEDLLEIKNLISRYFFNKARKEADKLINLGAIQLGDIEKAGKEITENRTAYLNKIRNESRH